MRRHAARAECGASRQLGKLRQIDYPLAICHLPNDPNISDSCHLRRTFTGELCIPDYRKKSEAVALLTREQFLVTQESATERAGTGEYLGNKEPGI